MMLNLSDNACEVCLGPPRKMGLIMRFFLMNSNEKLMLKSKNIFFKKLENLLNCYNKFKTISCPYLCIKILHLYGIRGEGSNLETCQCDMGLFQMVLCQILNLINFEGL